MARRFRAFTLIELLVVISILCLLIAILLPSFGRAKQAARRMTCISHLSGMGNGISGYCAANQSVLPPYYARVQPPHDNGGPTYLPVIHSWSQGGPGGNQGNGLWWRWSDFIISYFDTEARPAQVLCGGCFHIHVDDQPASGNYYEDATQGNTANGVTTACGMIMSKRMRCPDQPLTGGPCPYDDGCDYNFGENYHRYDRHYCYSSAAEDPTGYAGVLYEGGGDFWTIPNDGQAHTSDGSAEIQPVRGKTALISNFHADREILIREPYPGWNASDDLGYPYDAMDLFMFLPHQYDKDMAGNFCFMDGHVDTFTRTFIENWAANYYCHPGAGWPAPSPMIPGAPPWPWKCTGPFDPYPFGVYQEH
jgi:prepilin-type N-terminal cleavage/methylation domain-containing protein/prepilin-type processing-associated H-X9-DG protein